MSRFCCVPRPRTAREKNISALSKKKRHLRCQRSGRAKLFGTGLGAVCHRTALLGTRATTIAPFLCLLCERPCIFGRHCQSVWPQSRAPSLKSPQVFALGTPCLISPPPECQFGYPHQIFFSGQILTIFTDRRSNNSKLMSKRTKIHFG